MKFSEKLEEYRVRKGHYASQPGEAFGAFDIPGPCGARLRILADDGNVDNISDIAHLAGWEHVSVSTEKRIPNWREMCFVKNLFWAAEECCVQYHPPASTYVNTHSHVLHLWRWTRGDFPMPPIILV